MGEKVHHVSVANLCDFLDCELDPLDLQLMCQSHPVKHHDIPFDLRSELYKNWHDDVIRRNNTVHAYVSKRNNEHDLTLVHESLIALQDLWPYDTINVLVESLKTDLGAIPRHAFDEELNLAEEAKKLYGKKDATANSVWELIDHLYSKDEKKYQSEIQFLKQKLRFLRPPHTTTFDVEDETTIGRSVKLYQHTKHERMFSLFLQRLLHDIATEALKMPEFIAEPFDAVCLDTSEKSEDKKEKMPIFLVEVARVTPLRNKIISSMSTKPPREFTEHAVRSILAWGCAVIAFPEALGVNICDLHHENLDLPLEYSNFKQEKILLVFHDAEFLLHAPTATYPSLFDFDLSNARAFAPDVRPLQKGDTKKRPIDPPHEFRMGYDVLTFTSNILVTSVGEALFCGGKDVGDMSQATARWFIELFGIKKFDLKKKRTLKAVRTAVIKSNVLGTQEDGKVTYYRPSSDHTKWNNLQVAIKGARYALELLAKTESIASNGFSACKMFDLGAVSKAKEFSIKKTIDYRRLDPYKRLNVPFFG